jgi:DNA-binding GntR family transcriptional regulator
MEYEIYIGYQRCIMKFRHDTKAKSDRRSILPLNGKDDISKVRSLLADQPRNLLLFDMAVETGLFMKDLLQLQAKHVQSLVVGDELPVGGGSGGNPVISEQIHQTLQYYLREIHPQSADYIFQSKKGNRPLKMNSISDMIKAWFEAAGLNGLTGAKSLRKTWEEYYRADTAEYADSKSKKKNTLNPLKPVTLQELAYQELLRAFITRKVEPGRILVTDELAREMKISNRPVREALARLAQGGFVIPQKRRGFLVVELSKENLIEIMQIRLRLETMAGEEAAQCHSPETINRLKEIFQKIAEAEEKSYFEDTYQDNRDFHFTIYEAANMPILLQVINSLWDRWSPYHRLIVRSRVKSEKVTGNVLSIHQGMLQGMQRRDPSMVRKYIEQDLTWVIKDLMNTISI